MNLDKHQRSRLALEFPDLGEDAFAHRPLARTPLLYKGGGGGSVKYDNLERLYDVQADQAEQLGAVANQYVYPAFGRFMQQSQDYGSIANQNKAATQAGADAAVAAQQRQNDVNYSLTSAGVNVADPRYAASMRAAASQSAAAQAAATNTARTNVQNLGFARQQDAISLGMGVPSNAVAAANAASGTAGSIANMQTADRQASNEAVSNTVRGGISLAGYAMAKDGGYITKRVEGYVAAPERFATGGIVGAMRGIRPAAAPASAPAAASPGMTAATGVVSNPVVMKGLAKGAEFAGEQLGIEGLQTFGQSATQALDKFSPIKDAYAAAKSAVSEALPQAGLTPAVEAAGVEAGAQTGLAAAPGAAGVEAAGAMGAEAAGAGLAGAEAAGAGLAAAEAAGAATAGTAATAATTGAGAVGATGGALAGAGGAAAALGAAVPWVGAAVLAGSLLADLFADGGEVIGYGENSELDAQDVADAEGVAREDHTDGGEVDGPGGPKDDMIPAWLSDGEFVMPVGAVQFFGLDRLEKMRQKGLEYEQQLGIRR